MDGDDKAKAASGETISLNGIKQFIDSNIDTEWCYTPVRCGDVRHTKANTQPLSNLGWTAKINISEGLERCFK